MKCKRFFRVGVLLSALSAGLFLFTTDALAATKSLNVHTPSQEEIIQYINSHEKSGKLTYSQNPDSENPPYSAGSLSAQSQQEGLDALNEVRYIAGIASDVTVNNTYISQAQAGALINYVNNDLNHKPTQPAGMGDALFNLGYQGTSQGNISWASYERTLDQTLIHGWMADSSSSNLATVGHRRWCLNPSMKQTGFGSVTGSKGTYSVMYAFDTSRSLSTQPIVAWPAQNMPTDYFAANYPWSISSSTAFSDDVSVKLTRVSDNRVWNFSSSSADDYFAYNKGGYGQSHCLIFRPSGITAYYSGDQYRVQVTENQTVTLDYTVNFFDSEEVPADTTITLSSTSGKVAVSSDNNYSWVARVSLSNPDVSLDKIILSSSDETVAKALLNPSGLFIRGLKDGVATITLSLSPDISATFYVTVGTGDSHTHTYTTDYQIDVSPTCTQPGSKYRYCTGCGQKTDVTTIPATGHSYGAWQIVTAATCTSDGTKKRVCSVCHTEDTAVITAAGHKYGDWQVTKEADCTTPGTRERICSVCQNRETEIIPATGHQFGDWQVTKAATCTEDGSKTQICSVCNAVSNTTVIPATGHSFGDWSTTKNATCADEGSREHTCSVCGEKETEVIPAAGHNWDEGTVTQAPTQENSGTKTYTCKQCGGIRTENIPPLGGTPAPNTPVTPSAPAIGTVFSDAGTGALYQITAAGTVQYQGAVSKDASRITIPQAVTLDGKTYEVTSIAANAFAEYKALTSVVIGNGVTSIGTNAFSGCSKLKSVTIGKNVTSIGDKAFYKCTALTKITIPASVSRIGKQAFSGCKKLKNITVKTKKLTSKTVGSKAFKGIHAKATVKVPKAKLKAYKKLFRTKGVGKKARIKK